MGKMKYKGEPPPKPAKVRHKPKGKTPVRQRRPRQAEEAVSPDTDTSNGGT